MIRITVSLAGRSVQRFNLDKDVVTIGRDPDCDVPIDNLGISRKHATIEKSAQGFVLTDLKSHNGTYVQGSRVHNHRLAETDEFYIGKYGLTFEDLDAAKPEKPAVPARPSGRPQDLTFQLDRDEIQRLVSGVVGARPPKFTQTAPAKDQRNLTLDRHCYLVGGSPRAAIRIRGFRMPPFAAALLRDDKQWRLVVLTNRTVCVNDLPAADQPLSDGDVVSIGRNRFRFSRG